MNSNPTVNIHNLTIAGLIEKLAEHGLKFLLVKVSPGGNPSAEALVETRLKEALRDVAIIYVEEGNDVAVTVSPGGPSYDPLKGQVGGGHYKGMKIQHAEFCQVNRIPWCESAAIKYLCRHRDKNGVQDVDKAIHYCLIARKLEYPEAAPYQLPGQ